MTRRTSFAGLLAVALPSLAGAGGLTTLYNVPPLVADAGGPDSDFVSVGGVFYASTSSQGATNNGAIYKVDPATGKEAVVWSFTGGQDGAAPRGLTLADGTIYGVEQSGAIFTFDPSSNTVKIVATIPNGQAPTPLTQAGALLYGGTQTGGANGIGFVFSFDPASGAVNQLASYDSKTTGEEPNQLLAYGHALYGTNIAAGNNGNGTLYRVDLQDGSLSVLYTFTYAVAVQPRGALTNVGHTIYGTLSSSGTGGGGVFAYDTSTGATTFPLLFPTGYGPDGATPAAGLTFFHGKLYGTTYFGGHDIKNGQIGNGVLFSLDLNTWKETVLHRFNSVDGTSPATELLAGPGDVLYGTAYSGGLSGRYGFSGPSFGTVFSIETQSRKFAVLHDFTGLQTSAANYETTAAGGALYVASGYAGNTGLGAIIRVAPQARAGKVIYSFPQGGDAAQPSGALLDVGGVFYGPTTNGGPANLGTIYKFDPKTGQRTTVAAFGGSDGALPAGKLVALNGLLYGVTRRGGSLGAEGDGVIFSLDPATGIKKTLYRFHGESPNGLAVLNGLLYGTSSLGGSDFIGAVFATDPNSGKTTTLYSFQGGADGGFPEAGLLAANGVLYGTTRGSTEPPFADATVFSLDPKNGQETVLADFVAEDMPAGAIALARNDLWGAFNTTSSGPGGLYSVQLTGGGAQQFAFSRQTGDFPIAGLETIGGKLYGTTSAGGTNGAGTVYRYRP